MICCVCWFVLLDLVVLVLVWCDDSQCSSTAPHITYLHFLRSPQSQPASAEHFLSHKAILPCQSILGSRPVKTYRITAHTALTALVTLSHSRDIVTVTTMTSNQ